jgi:hypothetical protein
MPKPTRTEGVPHDRLTRIGDAMTVAFDVHAEHREGDRCIVFLQDGQMGGIAIHGYEDDSTAIVDLLLHIRAMFAANGKSLEIGFMNDDGFDFLPVDSDD